VYYGVINMTENVVSVEIPMNLKEAAEMVEKRYKVSIQELLVQGLQGELEAGASGGFEDYEEEQEPVPLMLPLNAASQIKWWFKVARRQKYFDGIGDFLMDSVRKYMHSQGYLKKVTDEEREELNTVLVEIGVRDRQAFSKQIEEIIK
jgi:hypothetical protein